MPEPSLWTWSFPVGAVVPTPTLPSVCTLNLTFSLFQQIAILSGTDYNINDNDVSLNETMKWYKEFVKTVENDRIHVEYEFYNWLNNNTKYITNFKSLLEIHNMFTITSTIDNINISIDKDYDLKNLQNMMSNYGFIFV